MIDVLLLNMHICNVLFPYYSFCIRFFQPDAISVQELISQLILSLMVITGTAAGQIRGIFYVIFIEVKQIAQQFYRYIAQIFPISITLLLIVLNFSECC